LSSAVVNVSDSSSGWSCLRSINRVNTPPLVSIPSRQGRHVEQEDVLDLALSTPPWIAAPTATTSSGFTPLCGSLPISLFDLRLPPQACGVMPPTSTT